ncbi:MAG TPA: thiamine pyrophosphate-dependent enzyme [Dehalococcoidia bacterium]|nr:thiamine pyrophosphate-dependent enzyme [Dehalococcoidia bacterium]
MADAMPKDDVIAIIAELKGEAISVATMQAIPPWHAAGGAERRHVDCVGAMGSAASIGLGLALAQPGRKVIVLDGDGSLLMQLGSLASIAGAGVPNFYHFVFVNRVYETSGLQPIPAAAQIDFPALARAAGYPVGERFADIGVLRERLGAILDAPGPALIALEVAPEEGRPFPPIRRAEQARLLREELAGT